jgi:hypothetical protein
LVKQIYKNGGYGGATPQKIDFFLSCQQLSTSKKKMEIQQESMWVVFKCCEQWHLLATAKTLELAIYFCENQIEIDKQKPCSLGKRKYDDSELNPIFVHRLNPPCRICVADNYQGFLIQESVVIDHITDYVIK